MTATPLALRAWQAECIPLALAALEERRAGVVVATTGAGKSIALAEMLRRWRETHPASEGTIVVTTPSRKLVEQLAGTFADVLGAHVVGRYYTRAKQWAREVVVCCNPSVPALAEVLRANGRKVGAWLADECFPAGTPITMADGSRRPIEAVRVGDLVLSWDESTAGFLSCRVVRNMCRSAPALVRVDLVDGRSIVCTPEHPFLTEDGSWRPAKDLYGFRLVCYYSGRATLQYSQSPSPHSVSPLWEGAYGFQHAGGAAACFSERDLLLGGVYGDPQRARARGELAGNQPAWVFEENEGEQSHAQPRHAGSAGGDVAGARSSAADPGGEWARGDDTASDAGRGTRLGHRTCDSGRPPSPRWIPVPLQDRCGELVAQSSDRGGRVLARTPEGEGDRCEENGHARIVGVACISLFEPRGAGEPSQLRQCSEVFNLEVEGTHTYIAAGIVVHNCHKTEVDGLRSIDEDEGSDTGATAILAALQTDRRLGFTATPFRSDETQSLSLFSEVVYRYPPADALRDGVIVPWRIVGWEDGRPELPIDDACAQLILDLGDRTARGPGVINAATIEDAEAYVAFLARHGLDARPIHSRQPRAEQEANIGALRDGAIDAIVHVAMLVEGVDFPWLRWLCLRRPVGARVRFIQEVGRVLRSAPGKTEAVLLDPHDLFGAFQLSYDEALGWKEPDPATDGPPREEREACDDTEKEPRELRTARVTALGRYCRQLLLALVAEGIASGESKATGTAWRAEPPSEKQLAVLVRAAGAAKRLDPLHAACIRRIAATPAVATRGIVSDCLSLCFGLDRLKKGSTWTPAAPVAPPPDSAFEPVTLPADTTVYVAGVMRQGIAALAITRGGSVLYSGARPARYGDTWSSLTRRGVEVARARFAPATIAVADEKTARALGLDHAPQNPAVRAAWASLQRSILPQRESA